MERNLVKSYSSKSIDINRSKSIYVNKFNIFVMSIWKDHGSIYYTNEQLFLYLLHY